MRYREVNDITRDGFTVKVNDVVMLHGHGKALVKKIQLGWLHYRVGVILINNPDAFKGMTGGVGYFHMNEIVK